MNQKDRQIKEIAKQIKLAKQYPKGTPVVPPSDYVDNDQTSAANIAKMEAYAAAKFKDKPFNPADYIGQIEWAKQGDNGFQGFISGPQSVTDQGPVPEIDNSPYSPEELQATISQLSELYRKPGFENKAKEKLMHEQDLSEDEALQLLMRGR